jgi:hypothetical protein
VEVAFGRVAGCLVARWLGEVDGVRRAVGVELFVACGAVTGAVQPDATDPAGSEPPLRPPNRPSWAQPATATAMTVAAPAETSRTRRAAMLPPRDRRAVTEDVIVTN